jgi:hypothetical protein
MTAAPRTKQTTCRDLAKQADALLKCARCDIITGVEQDKNYRRNKRAKSKRLRSHWRARRMKLGKFGAASPVRIIAPDKGC